MLHRLITALCVLLAGVSASHARQLGDSASVCFPIGSADIDPALPGNRSALDSIRAWLSPSDTSRLKSIEVYGAASPDGPASLNAALSRLRAENLAQWISSHTACPDSLISIVTLGADWSALRRILVSDPGIPESRELVRAIDSVALLSKTHNYPPSTL